MLKLTWMWNFHHCRDPDYTLTVHNYFPLRFIVVYTQMNLYFDIHTGDTLVSITIYLWESISTTLSTDYQYHYHYHYQLIIGINLTMKHHIFCHGASSTIRYNAVLPQQSLLIQNRRYHTINHNLWVLIVSFRFSSRDDK